MTVSTRRVGVLAALASLMAGTAVTVTAAPASAGSTTATCAPIVVIAARGTGEPAGSGTGPFGNTYTSGGIGYLALSPLVNELAATPAITVRSAGLIYEAGQLQNVTAGVVNLREELNKLSTSCPSTRTVLLGFSQGATVIGEAFNPNYTDPGYPPLVALSTAAKNKIAAVTFFGDPGYRKEDLFNDPRNTGDGPGVRYRAAGNLDWIASRLHSYCYDRDTICDHDEGGINPADWNWTVHNEVYADRLNAYPGSPVQWAWEFIMGKLGLGGYPAGGGNTTPIPSASAGVILQEIGQAGGYTGPVDGAPGTYTWSGVQRVMRGHGYTGPIDGAPGTNTYAAMQRLAQLGGYTGPVDGALGVNSWKGLQTILRGFGYTGPIDGVPSANTYAALQRLAKLGGYTGPADGVLGANSWKGVQKVMSGYGYTGPVDGVPGINTYSALQRMAQLGGYTGPVDGVPGPNTWAALGRLI
ncbi:cutinase family protein [Catellatospora vulcania]|uniref:cutinase family protein n=1 Tax=Catellatospora vulcania TaxID=1460450 RepID=UPI0012D443B4|nr:cutinase family protein [Catellatospora vulcania]